MKTRLLYGILPLLFYACQQPSGQELRELKKDIKREVAAATRDSSYILSFRTNASAVKMYWGRPDGQAFRNFDSLNTWLLQQHKAPLRYAMNAGMYRVDNRPLGLYIEQGLTKRKLNTRKGNGNFYLLPNGVFYITRSGKAGILPTDVYQKEPDHLYATQSGPLLVIKGKIHPAFNPHSTNVTIRNGVGILPDGQLLFAMSRSVISFYDFAQYFLDRGCRDALYLDGGISKTYWPEKGYTDGSGNFGVMIGISE